MSRHILMGVLIMVKTGFASLVAVVWANVVLFLLFILIAFLSAGDDYSVVTTLIPQMIPLLYYVMFPVTWVVLAAFELKEWQNLNHSSQTKPRPDRLNQDDEKAKRDVPIRRFTEDKTVDTNNK